MVPNESFHKNLTLVVLTLFLMVEIRCCMHGHHHHHSRNRRSDITTKTEQLPPKTLSGRKQAKKDNKDRIVNVNCSNLAVGNYAPAGVQCPDYYIKCENNSAMVVICAMSLRFSKKSRSCMNVDQIPGCFCLNKPNGNVSNPFSDTCAAFIRCKNQVASFSFCPGALVFNDLEKRCLTVSETRPPCGNKAKLPKCGFGEVCSFEDDSGGIGVPKNCTGGCEDGLKCRMKGRLAGAHFCLEEFCGKDEDCDLGSSCLCPKGTTCKTNDLGLQKFCL